MDVRDTVDDDLRQRLRRETLPAHAALDGCVSRFDLATREGLGRFLSMQAAALGGLHAVSAGAAAAEMMAELRGRALADLGVLGCGAPGAEPWVENHPHPLALDYVMTGSRLGTQVLKRRWQLSENDTVRAASSYFGAADHLDLWREFCARARLLPAAGGATSEIVDSTNRLFSYYLGCANSKEHAGDLARE